MPLEPGQTHKVLDNPHDLSRHKQGDGPPEINHILLERAEEVVADFANEFIAQADADIETICAAFDAVVAGEDPAGSLNSIFETALNLKGQGGSFGYGLITEVADSLQAFTLGRDGVDDREQNIIRAHIDTLRLVVAKRMEGDGDEEAQSIVAGLRQLTEGV